MDLLLPMVGVYSVCLILIGIRSAKKTSSGVAYCVADRSLGWFRCSSTLSATVVSGSATIVAAHLVARYGLAGLWFNLVGCLGLVALGCFFAPAVRRSGCLTLPDFAGQLYDDPWIRRLASWASIVASVAWIALLIRSVSEVVARGLPGLDADLVVAALVLVLVFYTLAGGQRAVADSDVVQLVVLLVGFLAIGVPMVWASSRAPISALSAEELRFPVSRDFSWGQVALFGLLYGLPHAIGPDVFSKVLAAKDEATARLACLASASIKLVFGLGIAVLVLKAKAHGLELDGSGPASGTLYTVFDRMLPSPMDAVVLLALIAILMSSLDTVLLTASAILAHDLVARTGGGPDRTLLVARIGGLSIVILAGLLLLDDRGTVIALFQLGYTVFAAGVAPVILLGFFRERLALGAGAARLAMIVGGGGATLLSLAKTYWPGAYWVGEPVMVGFIVSCSFLFAGSVLGFAKRRGA